MRTNESGYFEPDEIPQMGYEQINFLGKNLNAKSNPYRKVVNMGYTIFTKDEELLQDLTWNERYKNGIIDWMLFRVGKTVLFATNNKIYGCIAVDHVNRTVQLNEIIDQGFIEDIEDGVL